MATLFAGTSGFAYPAWKPEFYPPDVPAARFLEHYASRLNCVEINYTFRRMPRATTLESWVSATPPGFVFVMKAHQRITHMQRLKGAEESTAFFLEALEPLRRAGRLGPVLFQLPPNLKRDMDRLAAFLELLPAGLRVAFEFRDASWFSDDVYELLRGHDAALCLAESEKLVVPEVLTADFVYYRLRKPGYSAHELEACGLRARDLVEKGSDVYLVFKHEESPTSARDAERLLQAAEARAA
jgi:uncharacterized protein YecE (DUF72 family)